MIMVFPLVLCKYCWKKIIRYRRKITTL